MQVIGKIEHGVQIKALVKYQCLKCGELERLEFNHVMSDKTVACFKNMIDAQLCLNCHVDSKIPEIVDCLMN